ncbi:DUF2750 domain-containing protein [Shewanella sp. NFH-SH190041]|uniref:DUF2750 domain-containing protein n=1 Tax=Shewanella sp. NFH-SH190041 TaxID=2950245 RepID=UPI0021C44456|nr:DUF2750 domain-containing protein [Shewanella sp. NFH-SH190041]BDM63594.1 DUF2750 domain-containing protein [Shewanella sp. NFH-SH190041]
MSKTQKSLSELSAMTPEARYDHLVAAVKAEEEIWTLQDTDGCVMLTTEEEDCIPMWPSEDAAAAWAVDDWQDCEPLSIPLKDWLSRWVPGMEDDELFVAVFPVEGDLGVVIPPHELESRLVAQKRH